MIKKTTVKGIIILFAGLLAFTACQERLDEMNINPNAITKIPAEYLFTNAVRETFRANHHRTQVDFGGQYAHLLVSEGWDRTTDTYDTGHLRGDVTQEPFSDVYQGTIKYCNDILMDTAPDGDNPNEVQHALANIVAILNYAKLTDLFGDIPYYEGGRGKEAIYLPKYDRQEDIYTDMVETLKSSIDILKSADFSNAFPGADPIYNNDKDKWIRFANSFRLRLAMRARFVPETKSFYEGIIRDCLNEILIEDNSQNATLQHWDSEVGELYNPWYNKYRDWHESNLFELNVSEKFVDWLRATSDPRLEVLVTKSTLSAEYIEWLRVNNDPRLEYVKDSENAFFGMRNGLTTDAREGTVKVVFEGKEKEIKKWPRRNMSTYSLNVLAKDQPLYFMTASEICFLRAEAALYDLGPGDANQLYQKGIIQALDLWGIDPSDYLANSAEAILNGTVEEKFEQIATQMWVAFVPNNIEAWFNIRRTGYPVIERRTANDLSKGETDGYLPSRLLYPQTNERNINGANMQEAIDRMGGKDKINTRVWWDVRD